MKETLAPVTGNAYSSNPMTGFTKLFSTIVHSTVWREEMHVKIVWVTMLALADRNGYVPVSLPGLADASRVSLPQCEEALERLSAPDKYSRTQEHEGRRIEAADGGWKLLNYLKYREQRDADERRIKTRQAVARHRAKKAEAITVSTRKHNAEAEADAEGEAVSTSPDGLRQSGTASFQRLATMAGSVGDLKHLTAEQFAWMTPRDKDSLSFVGGMGAIKRKKPEHLRFMENDFVQAYTRWTGEE